MAIAFVAGQSEQATTTSAATLDCAFPGNTTAGNLLVAVVCCYGTAITSGSVAQSDATDSFTRATHYSYGADGYNIGIFYLANCPGGAFTVRYTIGATTLATMAIAEYSGAATSSVLEDVEEGNSWASNPALDTAINATAGGLIVLGTGTDNSVDYTSVSTTDFTNREQQLQGASVGMVLSLADRLISSTTTYNATGAFSPAQSAAGYIVAASFLAASGGGTSAYPRSSMNRGMYRGMIRRTIKN